ncbi:MAG: hypothetical protein NTY46_01700 [Candidatus Sumerlaeota bacterium]|nr:hypothetical protein [Candidatus Sumerlaeota bacterium]
MSQLTENDVDRLLTDLQVRSRAGKLAAELRTCPSLMRLARGVATGDWNASERRIVKKSVFCQSSIAGMFRETPPPFSEYVKFYASMSIYNKALELYASRNAFALWLLHSPITRWLGETYAGMLNIPIKTKTRERRQPDVQPEGRMMQCVNISSFADGIGKTLDKESRRVDAMREALDKGQFWQLVNPPPPADAMAVAAADREKWEAEYRSPDGTLTVKVYETDGGELGALAVSTNPDDAGKPVRVEMFPLPPEGKAAASDARPLALELPPLQAVTPGRLESGFRLKGKTFRDLVEERFTGVGQIMVLAAVMRQNQILGMTNMKPEKQAAMDDVAAELRGHGWGTMAVAACLRSRPMMTETMAVNGHRALSEIGEISHFMLNMTEKCIRAMEVARMAAYQAASVAEGANEAQKAAVAAQEDAEEVANRLHDMSSKGVVYDVAMEAARVAADKAAKEAQQAREACEAFVVAQNAAEQDAMEAAYRVANEAPRLADDLKRFAEEVAHIYRDMR